MQVDHMDIQARLSNLGVNLPGRNVIHWDVQSPAGSANVPRNPSPKVSCLMVTRGDTAVMRYSLQCYSAQDWPDKELVIVTDADREADVRRLIDAMGLAGVKLIGFPKGVPLGDLRNIAVARAEGGIIMQWDDDDLFDPQRIRSSAIVLLESGAAAAFLRQWLIWWPARNLAAISSRRLWEGSMAIWREEALVYPSLARSEDEWVVERIARKQPIAIVDSPLTYIYTVTGKNTWHSAHFENLVNISEAVFEGDDYRDLVEMLNARVPIVEYGKALRRLEL